MIKRIEELGDSFISTAITLALAKGFGIEPDWCTLAVCATVGAVMSLGAFTIRMRRKLPVDRNPDATASRSIS